VAISYQEQRLNRQPFDDRRRRAAALFGQLDSKARDVLLQRLGRRRISENETDRGRDRSGRWPVASNLRSRSRCNGRTRYRPPNAVTPSPAVRSPGTPSRYIVTGSDAVMGDAVAATRSGRFREGYRSGRDRRLGACWSW
jgi:hypothetical protein